MEKVSKTMGKTSNNNGKTKVNGQGRNNMIKVECPKCGYVTTIIAVKLEKRIEELEKELRMLKDADKLKRQCGGNIFNDIFGMK